MNEDLNTIASREVEKIIEKMSEEEIKIKAKNERKRILKSFGLMVGLLLMMCLIFWLCLDDIVPIIATFILFMCIFSIMALSLLLKSDKRLLLHFWETQKIHTLNERKKGILEIKKI